MKKRNTLIITIAVSLILFSCDDFIEETPKGVIDEEMAYSSPEEMVTAAYASMGDCWYEYPFNLWPYGDVTSDDCLKGRSGTTDTGYHPLEVWTSLTSSVPDEMDQLWYRLYCNISRCNRALISLEQYGDEKLGADTKAIRIGEMKFIRAHNYFKLLTLFRQIPWIDEEVLINGTHEQTRNDEFSYEELFAKVIQDFQDAYDALPEEQSDGGRVNKIAAASYLAKCYLTIAWGDGYEATNGVSYINKEYMQKVVDFTDDVVNSKYGYLEDYGDIFLPEYKIVRSPSLPCNAPIMKTITLNTVVPIGQICLTVAGEYGLAVGIFTNPHRT